MTNVCLKPLTIAFLSVGKRAGWKDKDFETLRSRSLSSKYGSKIHSVLNNVQLTSGLKERERALARSLLLWLNPIRFINKPYLMIWALPVSLGFN